MKLSVASAKIAVISSGVIVRVARASERCRDGARPSLLEVLTRYEEEHY